MKKYLLVFLVCLASLSFSQIKDVKVSYNYKSAFDEAYQQNPDIPHGMLEAVAYTNSRIWHISANEPESCIGMPKAYGVMGLILDGKNWFKENLKTVSQLSGYSINDIIENPAINIKAYAAAFTSIKTSLGITGSKIENHVAILRELSEIYVLANDAGNDYALNSQLYGILSFLNTAEYSSEYNFPIYTLDLVKVFGENNLKILSSPKIQLSSNGIINEDGIIYQPKSIEVACPDYLASNCSWVASPNYSSRAGTSVSAVTIHDVEGSYAGCISWFQNTSSQVSAHYVIRSSDGQCTQMVLESNKAWHVGSENPYTIGFEHEGYASQTGWYTTAMYQSSANIVKDICNSGYGIIPVSTGFWPWLATTYYNQSSIPGSCTKVKGHQHYPNQTHTDPGPNWDWDYYYKLINDATVSTSLTTATGNFYDSGGSGGNYTDNERKIWVISPAGTNSVTMTFSSFDLENTWDYLYIYNGTDVWAPLIGRYTGASSPGTVTASSGSMTIEFRSDCSTIGTGWAATWSSQGVDNIAPTTNVTSTGNWKTANFTATFTDADNGGGSGIEKSFYQVLDNNGTDWRANKNNGFFADNFDIALNPEWTNSVGTWQTANGYLEQGDTSQTNTNIYATLNQTLSNRYLYQFYAKIGTGVSGTNQRRFGFHFFCDNGSLPNRGNGYFIFFRQETSKLEFYKVANDVFTQVKIVDNVTTNINQLYEIKVIYDRISGKIDVYRDNIILGTWTDTAPYSTGNYISFRSGNSHLYISELKIYRSRSATASITLGGSAYDIRYQNPNPTTYGAKIKSICNDVAGNFSAISYHDLNVDWTAPSNISAVFEGLSNDVDTIFVNDEISANWTASADPNSGLAHYWYCIGSTPNGTNVLNWTDNGTNVSFIASSLSLSYNQSYYVSVKAENVAGLQSAVTVSDGVFVKLASSQPIAGFTYSTPYVCSGIPVDFINTSSNATTYQWTITGPENFNSISANPSILFAQTGAYSVNLVSNGPGGTDTIMQTVDVTVYSIPTAFAGNDQDICEGESLTLSASGGIQFQWNNGVLNGMPFTPLATNSYTVTVTDGNNCTDIDVVLITVNPVPDAIAGIDQTVCSGTSVTLNATGGDYYYWDNSVINNVPFFPSGSATYTVTVTNVYNCSDIASLTVNVNPLPIASFSAMDTSLVLPDNASAVFINSSANATSYLWDFGDGYTSYDENSWHAYTAEGYYTIILYAFSNNCGTDTLIYIDYIHVINANNINNIFSEKNIIVSPNPFTDKLTIYLNENSTSDVAISITDMLGRSLFTAKEHGINGVINIHNLKNTFADGVYILHLKGKDFTKSLSIIKESGK